MLDLGAENGLFAGEVRAAIEGVLASQQYINGPAVRAFEAELSAELGDLHAIAVSSGTDALTCALMAAGIGPGDEVIVPTLTFFASAGCVHRVGATPVFVDIDPRTFNLDPQRVADAVTKKTKAILPVHLFGQCAEMDQINGIATEHGLVVIEDAAQAIGATYKDRPAGGLGLAGCLSFYPTKNLGGFGEGGMVLTRDESFAEVCRQLRVHGQSSQYLHERIGANFRMDTIQAAILRVKLKYLDEFTTRRRRNAARYDELLADAPVECPLIEDHNKCVYHQYSILCDRRDDLRAHLSEHRIGSGVYYPVPLHRQPCFSHLGARATGGLSASAGADKLPVAPGAFPIAERVCERVLSLPVHPMLTDDDLIAVARCIHSFYGT